MPGGHGRTSEQADAASGPVPKHPGPPPSYFFLFTSFGLVQLDLSLLRTALLVGKEKFSLCQKAFFYSFSVVNVIGNFGERQENKLVALF